MAKVGAPALDAVVECENCGLHRSLTGMEKDGVKARELIAAVLEMHKAEQSYGCGFYNQSDWSKAYRETLTLAEALSKTDTSGAGNG